MTTFGGTCCRPSALRSRLSTTTILVKDVTITATNGASASPTTVRMMSAGLRLLKSIGFQCCHLHAQHFANGYQLTLANDSPARADQDARIFQTTGKLKDIARLESGNLAERHRQSPELEFESHRRARDGIRRQGLRSLYRLSFRHGLLRFVNRCGRIDGEAGAVVGGAPRAGQLVRTRAQPDQSDTTPALHAAPEHEHVSDLRGPQL